MAIFAGVMNRIGRSADGVVSSAVLLREAARTARQWQTYAARAGFSGVLFGVFALVILGLSSSSGTDPETAPPSAIPDETQQFFQDHRHSLRHNQSAAAASTPAPLELEIGEVS